MLGNEHAAVHTARTPNSNDKLAFPFLDILGHQKINHAIQMINEFLSHRPFCNVICHFRHCAALMAHRFNIERIGQEAHIQNHISIQRHSELKAKREHIDIHLLPFTRPEQPMNLIAQLCLLQFGCIDNIGSFRPGWCQTFSFFGNTLRNTGGRCHWMTAPGLLISANDDRICCIHEHHFIWHIILIHIIQYMNERIKKFPAARIDHQYHFAYMIACMLAELYKFRYEYRWQIIYHKIPQIFHITASLRFACP